MFDNYMLVINATGDSWPDERKHAVLLHAVGTEGHRLFYTLPDTGITYASAVEVLKIHFVPKVNVIAERHKFRQRAQRPDEPINQFLAALRELAAACEFGDMEEQMLRDQLIERAANTPIRDRLLLEPDLTLAKAATLALQIEAGLRYAGILSDATTTTAASVRAIHKQPRRSRQWEKKKPASTPAPAELQKTGNRRSCYRCGSTNHLANKPSCPAVKVTCNSCGKVGHFSKVCRSGQKEQDHDDNLRRVLHALHVAGLKLNMQKCKFKTSLRFMGHTISKEGLHPDQDRVSAVANAPAPHDTSSLRSFLGLASWYSKLIPDVSTVGEPLRATLREATELKFTWTAEADSSFTEIKRLIAVSPALALYDPKLPTYVSTDASDYGLGGVLTQIHPDNTERIVAFASRTFSC
ncbi:hypothetical protein SKAU_G00278510 [Synaphobranchus kaupii]|uniref:CCHC-type domain-containing protein n=1 Tax=Synaphobranchus kaupii TaxID=118154 RepID=A0A9Q1INR4_SYNKA|nr:hypothetical protein SKAU_G00278510 [Synaphobranchus kaupii]